MQGGHRRPPSLRFDCNTATMPPRKTVPYGTTPAVRPLMLKPKERRRAEDIPDAALHMGTIGLIYRKLEPRCCDARAGEKVRRRIGHTGSSQRLQLSAVRFRSPPWMYHGFRRPN